MATEVRKVVVVGGGFGGINLVKKLANDHRFQVTLVDRYNYHSFTPLLYQVGMAFIEPSNISYPFRRLFQEKDNLRFHLGCLLRVNMQENTIETDTGVLPYDDFVLALGTESNYFGMENVKKHAWPLKTITDATNLRNHLLLNMEKAARTTDPVKRKELLNVVIAGGGPTGVEVAGMLAEMAQHIAPKEYPEITRVSNAIYLIEAAPVLLGPMSEKSQEEATNVLKKLGVQVKLNVAVKDYVDGKVVLASGETIPTNALIWTSGVIGREVRGLPENTTGRARRIIVDEYGRVKGTTNIFAIGDIALHTSDPKYPNGHPMLAQVAIQQGKHLAANLKRTVEGQPMLPFVYKDKGSMAIISKYKAVVDLPTGFMKGFIAWLVWLFVHLIPITSFRNKVKLAFSWMWSFITNDPTLRLIIRPQAPNEEVSYENYARDPSPTHR